MKRHTLWNDWVNSEVYREFVDRYPLYRALNRRLADLADLGRARRVLDLGSGTGATTSACLELLGPRAEIIGVDSATTMVEVARSVVTDPRASFHCVDVADLSVSRFGRFDRVICNAASWLFPSPSSILADLKMLLAPDGLLVFNIPAERIEGAAGKPHPFQVELGLSLQVRLRARRPLRKQSTLDPARIEATLEHHGFRITGIEVFRHEARQEELMALMHIPAMAARLVPGGDHQQGLEIVRSAAARSDPELEVKVPWLYFVARRVPATRSQSQSIRR